MKHITFRRLVETALALVLPCALSSTAQGAPANRFLPLSPAWRQQFMFQHGFVNRVGAPGVLRAAASGKYLYVADYELSVILVFDAASIKNPQALGFISDGVSYPAAITVDGDDNLYVANEGNSTVTVYAPGSTSVATTIPTIFPLALAFGRYGTLYVGGAATNGPNEIEIFPKQGPPAIVAAPDNLTIGGIAVNRENVVTVTANDGNPNGTVFTYPQGIHEAPVAQVTVLGAFEGISYDARDRLYASDFSTNQIFVYTPPSFTNPKVISSGVGRPIGNAIFDSTLFVANSGIPDVTAYTSIKASPISYTNDMTFPTAVAVSLNGLSRDQTIYTVQECNCSEVDVYADTLPTPSQIGTIGRGVHTPSGIWLDGGGNLYVANYGTHLVTELAAGSRAPIRIWTLGKPYAVAVDRRGTLYVSDQGANAVEIIPAGKSRPTGSFGCNNTYATQYLAVDSSSDVYVGCGTDVLKYTARTKTSKLLGLRGLTYAVGVAVDRSGNLYVGDKLGNAIDVFAPGATSASRVITNGIDEPSGIRLGATGRLYVTNLSGASNPIYAPNGNTPIGTIAGENLQDIAVGP